MSESIEIDQIVYFLHYSTMALFEAFNVNGVKIQNHMGDFVTEKSNETKEGEIVYKQKINVNDSRSDLKGRYLLEHMLAYVNIS